MLQQIQDPRDFRILITPPDLPELECALLASYGFSIELYADVLLNHISIGYDESMYNIVASECSDSYLPDSVMSSVTECFERIGVVMINYIMPRQQLHLLLICDIGDVEIDNQGNWLIQCCFNESKYAIAQNGTQYRLSLPNLQYNTFTPYVPVSHIQSQYHRLAVRSWN